MTASPASSGVNLLLISSSVESPQQLAAAAGSGVTAVVYDAANTTLTQLQDLISSTLNGRQANNIIFAADGQMGFAGLSYRYSFRQWKHPEY